MWQMLLFTFINQDVRYLVKTEETCVDDKQENLLNVNFVKNLHICIIYYE